MRRHFAIGVAVSIGASASVVLLFPKSDPALFISKNTVEIFSSNPSTTEPTSSSPSNLALKNTKTQTTSGKLGKSPLKRPAFGFSFKNKMKSFSMIGKTNMVAQKNSLQKAFEQLRAEVGERNRKIASDNTDETDQTPETEPVYTEIADLLPEEEAKTDADQEVADLFITKPFETALEGEVTMEIGSSAKHLLQNVTFLVNGVEVGHAINPYQYKWDSKLFSNGKIEIQAIANDLNGNRVESPVFEAEVKNNLVAVAEVEDPVEATPKFQVKNESLNVTTYSYNESWNRSIPTDTVYSYTADLRDTTENSLPLSRSAIQDNPFIERGQSFSFLAVLESSLSDEDSLKSVHFDLNPPADFDQNSSSYRIELLPESTLELVGARKDQRGQAWGPAVSPLLPEGEVIHQFADLDLKNGLDLSVLEQSALDKLTSRLKEGRAVLLFRSVSDEGGSLNVDRPSFAAHAEVIEPSPQE